MLTLTPDQSEDEIFCRVCFDSCDDCGGLFLARKVRKNAFFEEEDEGSGNYVGRSRCVYCQRLEAFRLKLEEEAEEVPTIKEVGSDYDV